MPFYRQDAKKQWHVLVIFDVSDDKRRYKLTKHLEAYGVRIQRSAFECMLTAGLYKTMLKGIDVLINAQEDIVNVYKFNEQIETKSWGKYMELNKEDFEII